MVSTEDEGVIVKNKRVQNKRVQRKFEIRPSINVLTLLAVVLSNMVQRLDIFSCYIR